MPKVYKITEEQISEIRKNRKINKDKNVERRLRAVEMRGDGLKDNEIAAIVGANPKVVSRWFCKYVKNGINGLLKVKREGKRRNMTLEEETMFIDGFKAKAEKGEIVCVKEIKIGYCEKIGHKCGNGQIYRVLARQNWRKVVPRKRHPEKASGAEIEASKKLTFG